jgi:hypothetical protein
MATSYLMWTTSQRQPECREEVGEREGGWKEERKRERERERERGSHLWSRADTVPIEA